MLAGEMGVVNREQQMGQETPGKDQKEKVEKFRKINQESLSKNLRIEGQNQPVACGGLSGTMIQSYIPEQTPKFTFFCAPLRCEVWAC